MSKRSNEESTRKGPSLLSLLWAIRDARSTSGAQRQLLVALALRCDESKYYSCWPSYDLLAEDCQLEPITLKRAAQKLEDANLIKRQTRANRSNKWFINVPLILQQAKANRDADKAAAEIDFTSPFGDSHIPYQGSPEGQCGNDNRATEFQYVDELG